RKRAAQAHGRPGHDPPPGLQLRETRRPPRLCHVFLPDGGERGPGCQLPRRPRRFHRRRRRRNRHPLRPVDGRRRQTRAQAAPARRRRPPHAAHGRVRRLLHGRDAEDRVKDKLPKMTLKPSRLKWIMVLLGCSAFVASAIFLIPREDDPTMWWLTVVFFGL